MKFEATDIRKSYGDHLVLDNVSISLDKGVITGLIGVNGVGKSTLLKILSGINQPDEGTLDISNLNVAYMSERNPLYPHMYVTEYLHWVANVKEVKNVSDRVDWVIERAGLTTVKTKKIRHLSKGFKQRVGLGATIVSDPDVIILDEPINGLDPVQIVEYRSLIKELARDKVVVLSSHLLQEIEAICDQVLLLKDGELSLQVAGFGDKQENYIIRVELDRHIDESQFGDMEDIILVSKLGEYIYHLEIASERDVRLEVFDQIIDSGAKIKELTRLKSDWQSILRSS